MTIAPRRPLATILRGMVLIGRGRAEGLNCFRDSNRAFLGSLSVGMGFIVVSVIEGIVNGRGLIALTDTFPPLCALLGPAVLSFEAARWMGREAFWGRYIVAFNWCQWLLPILLITGLMAVRALAGGDGSIVYVCVAGYALWMNWFIARHALALRPMRAAGFVATVNLGTMILVFGPVILTSSTR